MTTLPPQVETGNITKIDTGNFVIFICGSHESSLCFNHTQAETLALICRKLEFIDIDLIYSFFEALEGKHLTPQNWQDLIKIIKDFDPEEKE